MAGLSSMVACASRVPCPRHWAAGGLVVGSQTVEDRSSFVYETPGTCRGRRADGSAMVCCV